LNQYDSIVIGAGHNGLVCAAYLAQSGQRVLVLEAADVPGGLAADREFHPGFHVSVAHSINHFSKKVASDLNLAAHGIRAGTGCHSLVGLGANGTHVIADANALHNASNEDMAAYAEYSKLMEKFAEALGPFWYKTMPRIGSKALGDLMTFAHMGLKLRLMGKRDLQEFMRVASLPARDLMDEYFDDDTVKAALSWDGLIGSRMAPRSPNSAVLALLYRMSGESAGVRELISALCGAAAAAGAEIRTGSPVSRVMIDADADGLSASGVQLADGEQIAADRVISGADPRTTFVDLVGIEHLDIGFTNRIRRLRCNGLVAKLHLALDGLPEFSGLERPDGRMIVAPGMDAIEFAFDDAKYGQCSRDPVLEIAIPSLTDATSAPAGQHVLSAHVMYVPYRLKGGWTDAARDAIRDRAIDTIARYAPGIRDQIIHSEFLTPADLETSYRVTGGHWHHTEFAMDQLLMMRPTYEAAQYSTPIPGLYLCSAGSHPGGDIVGAAGHNAAQQILR
jgi:phytoene dehydrogenase-like protein